MIMVFNNCFNRFINLELYVHNQIYHDYDFLLIYISNNNASIYIPKRCINEEYVYDCVLHHKQYRQK